MTSKLAIKKEQTMAVKPPPKPKNMKFTRALFSYTSKEEDEISFEEGDLLYIIDDSSDPDWWRARCRGKEGLVPSNFLSSVPSNQKEGDAYQVEISPIHDACRRGNMELLEECLLNRVPVNVADKTGNTPLHYASRTGQLACLNRLLNVVPPVNVNAQNRLGDTPLHLAAWKGHIECINAFRCTGLADLGIRNGEDKTASEVCEEPEAKAELQKWEAALGLRSIKTVDGHDYGEESSGDEL